MLKRIVPALSALKIHPRDQLENRALLTRADRVYEETLGDHRQYLAAHIARFQSLLERAVGNLADNALRHNGPGGTIWITADAEDRPQRLYARLGFVPVAHDLQFVRVLA